MYKQKIKAQPLALVVIVMAFFLTLIGLSHGKFTSPEIVVFWGKQDRPQFNERFPPVLAGLNLAGCDIEIKPWFSEHQLVQLSRTCGGY